MTPDRLGPEHVGLPIELVMAGGRRIERGVYTGKIPGDGMARDRRARGERIIIRGGDVTQYVPSRDVPTVKIDGRRRVR